MHHSILLGGFGASKEEKEKKVEKIQTLFPLSLLLLPLLGRDRSCFSVVIPSDKSP